MKKVVVILILGAIFFISFRYINKTKILKEKNEKNSKNITLQLNSNTREKITPYNQKKITHKSFLFIPYWTDFSSLKEDMLLRYDQILYFGNGEEDAFKKFITIKHPNKYIVFQLNKVENIDDKIKNVTKIVNENNFQGAALDIEINSISIDDTTGQINNIVQQMYTNLKQNYRKLSVILYGDLFYRKRPFDMSYISKYSDEIMVMAYDFHKAGGEPGPNFPLSKGLSYQYDFKNMISDYLQFVPQEKLTIIFGMYGYDWIVDENNLPIKPAKALTLKQITSEYLPICTKSKCKVIRDDESNESKITYVDDKNDSHIIWFEDEKSARKKEEYLEQQGIGNMAYWAAGYF